MAQLAFAVAGTAIGAMFGAPQLGFLAGSLVGTLLFPQKGPDVTSEGPRLGDLSVSSSAYGAPIAIGFGTLRRGGNIIWSSGIREQKHVKKVSGGKGMGGGSQTSVTYSYFASFAIAFGEGPAEDVLRIWADGKLIYDKTGASPQTAKRNLRFRLHKGDESQLPDPLIESKVGTGRAPAHRGLCYIVFEDLALADFGNRIPNITAEITYRRTDQKPYQGLDFLTTGEGGYFSSYQRIDLAVDWTRGYGYFLTSSSDPALSGIRRFHLATMHEDRQARMSDVCTTTPDTFPGTLLCGEDGYLYLNVGSGNSRPIIRVDPNALKEVSRFGTTSNGLSNTTERFVALSFMGMVSAYGLSGRRDFILTGSVFDDIGLLDAAGLDYVWGAGITVDESRCRGCIGGAVGEGWVLGSGTGSSHTQLGLYRITVAATAFYDPLTGLTFGVAWEKVATLLPSDIEAGATAFSGEAGGLSYDATDNGVIFQVQIAPEGGTVYTIKWRDGDGIVWKTVTPSQINDEGPFFGRSRLTRQRWSLIRGARVMQIDTATGALVTNEIWPEDVDEWGAQVYDAETDTILVQGDIGWVKLFLGRGGGEGDSLSAIAADLCQRAGLGLADIEAAELTDTVPGYVIARQTPIRSAIEPLAAAYFFDGVESDDVLRFRKRGRTPVVTIGQADLVPLEDETKEAWRERRTQEVELPERVSVLYMDRTADYTQGTQFAKRASLPVPTMHARSQTSLDLPIALDATTAKRIAAKTLYSAWVKRAAYEASLSWEYLTLDPTDVVDVVLADGSVFRSRLTRVDVGADFVIAVRAVSQEAATYTATDVADGGSGVAAQVIPAAAATKLILADLPLLRDVDDLGGSGSRLYNLMAGFGPAGWPGAALYKSADGSSWSQVGAALGEAAWGATVNALGIPRSAFATDEDNALTVFMITGGEQLESVSQVDLVNGANPALVLKANGEPEIIQFRDVATNPDGSFTLKGLLRGRRGTDVVVAGHQPGELFVLMDPDDIESLAVALGDLGLARHWRAVGFGTLFEDADVATTVLSGRDLKPYAPWGVKAAKSGSPASITLSWVRRTRIGGEWKDGTGDVRLGETSEAYEVDILASPGGAVKRTLSSTAPSVTYANTDIVADFGGVPASLAVVVYQISAVIGRGFGRAVTLEVA
jgi:hypothetical protein